MTSIADLGKLAAREVFFVTERMVRALARLPVHAIRRLVRVDG